MMQMAKTLVATAFLGGLAASLPASPALSAGEFSAGPWRGMAFYENAEFVNCGMVGRGGAARVLFTLTPAGELRLGLHHGGMRYTAGKTFSGSIEINGGPANARTFKAAKRNVLVAPMGPLKDAMAALGQARKLRIRVADLTQDFEIENLAEALSRLAACVQKRGRGS